MNKKGQVLVIFVLLLPFIIMLLALLIDIGYLFLEKRKVDYVTKDATTYAVKHLEEEETKLKTNIKNRIEKNITNVDSLEIKIENRFITISVKKTQKSIFSVVFSKYQYKIETQYRGYQNEDDIIIRKE